jgi:hypothetical protein
MVRGQESSISSVLNKQLTHHIIRQTKTTAAIVENDAVWCYDRSVNPLLLLEMQHLGALPSLTQSIAKTWENTVHFIKTQYGILDTTYQNTTTAPLFGPGQGSTTGPTLWQLIFIIIVTCMGQSPPMLYLCSATGQDNMSNLGEAFIDDSNLGSTSSISSQPHETTPVDHCLHANSAMANLHIVAQCWERLLFSTGGAISLTKSFWFLFHWKWKNGKALRTDSPTHHCLMLTEGLGTTKVTVPRKKITDTYRTLGVYLSPSGDTKGCEAILLTKALDYSVKLAHSPLSREGALLSYKLYLIPCLSYPLPALTISEDFCATLQSSTLMAVLPKLYLNRHIARAIVFGPIQYGGLFLPHIYSLQGIGQLSLLVGHLRSHDKTSRLIKISLSHVQLQCSLSTPIFALDFKRYSS